MPRRLPRTVVSVLAALLAGALAFPPQPAAAAAPTPDIPRLPAIATIYPHVQGGDRLLTEDDVQIYGRTCSADPISVPRAAGIQADYFADDYEPPTPSKPAISLRALRFPHVKRAKLWADRYHRWVKRCLKNEGEETRNDPFDVDLGDASWGRSVAVDAEDEDLAAHIILVRSGTLVITAINGATNGRFPARAKAVRLAKLDLRVAT